MPSPLRQLKDTPLALRFLEWNCRRLLGKARRGGRLGLLTQGKTLYAIDRRVLEHLDAKEGWGLDASTPWRLLSAFQALREALAYLIEKGLDDEARAANHRLNNLEKRAKVERLRSYPIRCYFETTNRCNLRCQMCGQSFFKGERESMPRSGLERLSPHFKWFEEISIFGYGEALLVDYVAELLDAIPPHAASRLVTNGLLLTPENNRMLIDHGLKILFISLDAVDRETYRAIRGVDKLEEIKDNIRDLVAYRSEKGVEYPELTLTFVAMKRNIDQLPEFLKMAKSLGVNKVIADYLTVFSEPMREQSLLYDQERSDRYIAEAEEVAREIGVEFESPIKFSDPASRAVKNERCHEPWEFILFRADGYLQPCCTDSDKVARWDEGDFFDFWNCDELRKMRRTMATPEQSPWCRDCLHVCFRDIRKESSHVHIFEESREDERG